jgi:hypothetical protein
LRRVPHDRVGEHVIRDCLVVVVADKDANHP